MPADLSEYARTIQRELGRNNHVTRQALKNLIEQVDSLHVDYDARRAEAGEPDIILSRGSLQVSYIFANEVGGDLNALRQRTDKLQSLLPNLLLTNHLEITAPAHRARLATLRGTQIEADWGAN